MVLIDPEDESTTVHLNIGTSLPSDNVPQLRRLVTSATLLGEAQIA
jgi:hypothetical protein